ncbi:hypothetical protein B0H14DRAFT_2571663 [Mycena olivaceomarginata]|nr:hypothetical protein B0H14DRAFT_2571663 [Mycena olivaceomarginata]
MPSLPYTGEPVPSRNAEVHDRPLAEGWRFSRVPLLTSILQIPSAHGCRIFGTHNLTFPKWRGYLDNAGGRGNTQRNTHIRSVVQRMEEASLSEDLVRAHVRSAGCIGYFFRTAKGLFQPEVEYVYDMVIPAGADPAPSESKPLDGEVEHFDASFSPLDALLDIICSPRLDLNSVHGQRPNRAGDVQGPWPN